MVMIKYFWIVRGSRASEAYDAIYDSGYGDWVIDSYMGRIDRLAAKYDCSVDWSTRAKFYSNSFEAFFDRLANKINTLFR